MSGFPSSNDPQKKPPTFERQSPYSSPPVGTPIQAGSYSSPHLQPQTGDGTGGVIPYKNPMALIAYYCAVFSLMPCIGIPIGLAALILGILGLRAVKQNPIIKGTAHAWIGIIGGVLIPLLQLAVAVVFFGLANIR